MDCLYAAYVEHLRYLGDAATPWEYGYYRLLKAYSHGSPMQLLLHSNQPTAACLAPWIVRRLARVHHRHVFVKYSVFDRQCFRDQAVEYGKIAKGIARRTWYGPEGLWTQPCICLLLDQQHAVFAPSNPPGVPVLFMQLSRWKSYGEST
jgi:hypothetical protein